jgi:hypothetical protein
VNEEIEAKSVNIFINSDAKRRLRRSKDDERRGAKWLMEHDGPDPKFKPGGGIVSSTGRVGHVTALQFDALSLHYAMENKNEKMGSLLWTQWNTVVRDGIQIVSEVLPAELGRYWLKVNQRAEEWGKAPMIRINPTNDAISFPNGKRVPPLHIITEDRHAELLSYERLFLAKKAQGTAAKIGYSKEDQTSRSPGRRKK